MKRWTPCTCLLPTGIRRPWAILRGEAGKHVLVEKPVGTSAAGVREIIAACRRSGVQLMDGVMFMHSRRLESHPRGPDDGRSVGRITRIASHFTFGGSDEFFQSDIRTHMLSWSRWVASATWGGTTSVSCCG